MPPFRDLVTSKLGIIVIAGLIGSTLLYFFAFRETSKQEARTEADVAARIAELEEALKEARGTRDTLQRDLDRMTRERVDLDGELNRLKSEADAASKKLTETTEARERLTSEKEQLANRIESLTAELATVRSDAEAESREQATALASLKEKTEAEALAWAKTKGNLEQQLAEVTKRHDALAASPARQEIRALRERIVSLEQKLDVIGNQRNELARTLRAIEAARSAATKKPAPVAEKAAPAAK